jgi:hypothetical protein
VTHDPPFQNNDATTYVASQQVPQINSSFVTTPPLALLTPWSLQLVARAGELAGQGQHRFAIVLAHAACDWATQDVSDSIISGRSSSLKSR